MVSRGWSLEGFGRSGHSCGCHEASALVTWRNLNGGKKELGDLEVFLILGLKVFLLLYCFCVCDIV